MKIMSRRKKIIMVLNTKYNLIFLFFWERSAAGPKTLRLWRDSEEDDHIGSAGKSYIHLCDGVNHCEPLHKLAASV